MTAPLPITAFAVIDAATPADAGAAPHFDWIEISRLVVDPAYQRPISRAGRLNIIRIARDFRWRHFSPVVVSPIVGGAFAIVDGQHRTTAAAIVGFDRVPCVVVADAEAQAETFRAINGRQTCVSAQSLFHASVAGCVILRWPVPLSRQHRNETMAAGAVTAAVAAHGTDFVAGALSAVIARWPADRGGLPAPVIIGTCRALAALDGVDPADFAARLGGVDLLRQFGHATDAARVSGDAIATELARRLTRLLAEKAMA